MSSNEATTTAHLFKKTEDSTLSETDTNILAHCMKSVGSLVILHLGKDSCRGTVFRVGDRYVMTAYHVIEPIAGMLRKIPVWPIFHKLKLSCTAFSSKHLYQL